MKQNKWKQLMLASGLVLATAIFSNNMKLQASEVTPEVSIEGERLEAYGAATGSCGENATYVVEGDTLIISGTGAINKKISFSYSGWHKAEYANQSIILLKARKEYICINY